MSRTPRFANVSLSVLVGTLVACAEAPDSGVDSPAETGVVSQHEMIVPDDCDPLICPGNSDILAALGPFELAGDMVQVSSRGFRLESIKKGGVNLTTFNVAGATLSGSLPGPIALTMPAQFIGTRFHIVHDSGTEFDLVIEAYTHVPFFDITEPTRIHGYKISYQVTSGGTDRHGLRDLCKHTEVKIPGNAGPVQTWAIFWKGERYDPDTGEITASGLGTEALDHVGSWFNISCDNEAWVKVLRNEATRAITPGFPTRRSQATLNMFTAKYCPGDPTRYTELGKPLSWDDAWTTHTLGSISSIEAIWTADGAACLTRPRMYKLSDIACELDECSPLMVANWSNSGALISGNPAPPPLFIAPP
jgi:ADYC domain